MYLVALGVEVGAAEAFHLLAEAHAQRPAQVRQLGHDLLVQLQGLLVQAHLAPTPYTRHVNKWWPFRTDDMRRKASRGAYHSIARAYTAEDRLTCGCHLKHTKTQAISLLCAFQGVHQIADVT